MQFYSRFITLAVLVLFSVQSWATPQQLDADLQKIRLNSIAIMTNFYMFSGLDLDSRYKIRLEQNSAIIDEAFSNAGAQANTNGIEAEVKALNALWTDYQKLIESNLDDMTSKGFPNVRLVDEMSKSSVGIVAASERASASLYKSSGIEPNKIVKQARDLALLMEQITAQYAARNTSNLGQVFVGNSDYGLAEMADDFSKQLTNLAQTAKAGKSENLINSIQSKWRFMEQRIRNYNEDAVVFLVVSYNDKIIDHLQDLEAMYL